MGIAGLVILLLFILMAIFAPLLADESGLDVTQVDGPILAPPSWEYPLGTDDLGRSVLTLRDLGVPDLPARRVCWRPWSR